MKVKLLKIRVDTHYCGDYDEVIKNVVTDFSNFEDIKNNDYHHLVSFVKEYNTNTKDGTYLLIAEEANISIKNSIQGIKDTIERKRKESEEKERIAKEAKKAKYDAGAAKRAEKKREKLQKKLEELQQQIAANQL